MSLFKNKKIVLLLILLLTLLTLLVMLEQLRVINLFSSKTTSPPRAQTTSDERTAQEDFKDGTDRQPLNNNRNEGIAVDKQGAVGQTPDKSQWIISADGAITIFAPTEDGLLKTGDSVTGASTLPSVSFRLIDDVTGVIAQGSLKVVDGRYAGNFNFTTTANTGRLDIYNTQSDGTETSNVEVPIRFK